MIHPDNWDKLEQEIDQIKQLQQLLSTETFGFEDPPATDTFMHEANSNESEIMNNTPSINNNITNSNVPTLEYSPSNNTILGGQSSMLLTISAI